MSTVSQMETAALAAVSSSKETAATQKKSGSLGKTIGNPTLSEKGQKYYEELKKKYSDMDFILVSEDMKMQAKAQAASYANPDKMVVLIDEDKVERMAEDEAYRNQYEGIISGARTQFSQMKSSLDQSSANVKTFGMQINDNGTASYFAVIDKSLTSQKERIARKAEEKKAAEKKAAKKEAEENAKEANVKKANAKSSDTVKEKEDTVMVTASSLEELLQKINDTVMADMSDNVQTEAEKMVGQHIDFRW